MFHEISATIRSRMAFLEDIDSRDRTDGTARLKRLRQIPPETGKFIAILAASCPDGNLIEVGTSAGYSSLWISLALKDKGRRLKTFEILPEKVRLARETFRMCELEKIVELVEGDFLTHTGNLQDISFCFIDCEKHLYEKCFDGIAHKMVKGGIIAADNAINHFDFIKPMITKAENDSRFDCLVVPIGKGVFICRRK